MDTPATTPWSTTELLSETRWMRTLAGRLAAGTGEDPDDVVQDALVAALERRPSGDRSLRPWFARVVRNQLAFSRRGAARRRARERAAAVGEAQPPADELLERAELHARVVRALTELREPQRGVLLERFFGELSPSEIARRRGVPAATVRSWIHRGLAELRVELDRSLGDDPRRARLALLALARPPIGAPAGPFQALLRPLRTMNPAAQLLVAASTILVVGSQYPFGSQDPLENPGPSAIADPPPVIASDTALTEPASVPARLALSTPDASSPVAQDEATVTGTVRDDAGAPLPGFALSLRHAESDADPVWSEPELLWTDAEGHYTSLLAYPAGRLSITSIDHSELRVVARFARQIRDWSEAMTSTRDWAPDQGPVDLRAWVGPSFDLDLAGLGELDPAALTGSLEPVEDEPFGPLPSAWTALAPVRAGDPPWIRFPRLRGATEDERPWRLSIEGAGGLVAGEALVQLGAGAPTETVILALAPAARLDVTLTVGGAIANPAVTLEADPGGERRPMLPVAVEDLGEGSREVHFERAGLATGTYRVLVSIDDLDQLADTVTLAAGQAASRAIDLGAAAAGTRLSGELRSKSGTYHETTYVHVSDAAGEVLHYAPVPWVQQDGQWVAPFAVDNLPPEACELRLDSMTSYRRWSGLPVQVVPPAEGVLLVCDDTEPLHELAIRVVAASTGECIEGGWGTIALESCERSQMTFGLAGTTLFSDVPLGALTEWYAAAEGFVPRWGGAEALMDEGERLVAEAALEPGWGARIRTVRAGTLPAEPLAGVAILLDGELAGVTSAEGQLVLVRETAPGHVTAALAGWTYADGDLDPETGILAAYRSWQVLRFMQ